MITLKNLVPKNLQEEKQKFFADNSYNPQFTYENNIEVSDLTEHGLPQEKYLTLAQKVLDIAYDGKTEEDLFSSEGALLAQSDVTQKVEQFLAMHGLEDRFAVTWSSSFISRASVSSDTIKLRLPCEFRQEGLLGMLYHEIGTHALRRINYEKQPWFKKKSKFGFGDYLRTEEGLAVLHGLIPHSQKLAFIQAIRYLAVYYALTTSFSELWHKLIPYVDDVERRWTIVVRQKRGLTDTSKPGAFTKDLVYFEGMIEVWKWLVAHEFDITTLYFGKIGHHDTEKAEMYNPSFQPKLPVFFTHFNQEYVEKILQIGEVNMIDSV